jgi:hypothetical protein
MTEIDIARFEGGKLRVLAVGSVLIRRALEEAGIEFIGQPPSVKLRDSE